MRFFANASSLVAILCSVISLVGCGGGIDVFDDAGGAGAGGSTDAGGGSDEGGAPTTDDGGADNGGSQAGGAAGGDGGAGGDEGDGGAAPVAFPDLVIDFANVTIFDDAANTLICLNRNPEGDEVDLGDMLVVLNSGDVETGPYHVALSLYSAAMDTEYSCPSDLDNDDGTPAEDADYWDGPWCCDLGVIPEGDYYLVAEVDPYGAVAEDDETNNVWQSDEVNVD